MKYFKKMALFTAVFAVLASCNQDDFKETSEELALKTQSVGDIPGTKPLTGPWVISGQNNSWGGGYQRLNSLPTNLSLSGGHGVLYAVGGRGANGNYFTLNNTNNGTRGIRKFTVGTGNPSHSAQIDLAGGIMTFQTFETNFHIFNYNTGYYTDVQQNAGKIYLFNPDNMTTTGDWDLNSEVGNAVPGFSGATYKHIGGKMLIRRDNTIYADVTFGNSLNAIKQVNQLTNFVYVAAIDATTGALISVSQSPVEATNIGLFNDHPMVNEDPVSHAIYFATVSDMGANIQNVPSHIFKIPNGSNTIEHVVAYSSVSNGRIGEFNGMYAYNNHIYTKFSEDDVRYLAGGEHGIKYRNPIWQWTVVTPSGQARDLDMPKDNFYSYQQPRLINGELYFIFNTGSLSGIRKIAPVTGGNGIVSTTVVSSFTTPYWIWPTTRVRITGIDRL